MASLREGSATRECPLIDDGRSPDAPKKTLSDMHGLKGLPAQSGGVWHGQDRPALGSAETPLQRTRATYHRWPERGHTVWRRL
jgi:hypothetical protein